MKKNNPRDTEERTHFGGVGDWAEKHGQDGEAAAGEGTGRGASALIEHSHPPASAAGGEHSAREPRWGRYWDAQASLVGT